MNSVFKYYCSDIDMTTLNHLLNIDNFSPTYDSSNLKVLPRRPAAQSSHRGMVNVYSMGTQLLTLMLLVANLADTK